MLLAFNIDYLFVEAAITHNIDLDSAFAEFRD